MERWETVTLEKVAAVVMGQSPSSRYYNADGEGAKFLQGCAEFGSMCPNSTMFCSNVGKVAPKGSILFSVRAPVGRINIADVEYCIGRGVAAIVPRGHDTGFLFYLLSLEKGKFDKIAKGSTFTSVNSGELKDFPLFLPANEDEQSAIARILTSIEKAIDKTEALIAKYRRIKTGLMQDLLTKGIDEYGRIRSEKTHRFKDSPLGRIPEDWEISNLGEVTLPITSGSRGWARFYSQEGSIFLRITNLTRNHVNLDLKDLMFVRPPETSEGRRTLVEPGDILISITADLGIIGIVPCDLGEAYVNQHIALARVHGESVNPGWVAHYLASGAGQRQFLVLNDAGAKAGLNLPTVASLKFARPERAEQDRLAKILDNVDAALNRQKTNISKLYSLKTGLMQDLLTGRVRVPKELIDRISSLRAKAGAG